MYLQRIVLKNLKSIADMELDFKGEEGVRLHTALGRCAN